MQAWTVPPLNPPGEVRLQDNLQWKGFTPAARRRDRIASATVEILGLVEDGPRVQDFRAWLSKDLSLAFQSPPPRLGSIELGILMANPTDPMKAILDQVRFTRGWYQAPMQVQAEEEAVARAHAIYR
ncbi:MAG: hypothetical protein JST05_09070 [Acidobacteria bacterium]|nr:hypothetical protein [Acidobacteriota bacterium]